MIGLLVLAAGTAAWVLQKMEGESFIEIAKEAKVKATAEADGLIQDKVSDNRATPTFQQAPSLEIRGGTEQED